MPGNPTRNVRWNPTHDPDHPPQVFLDLLANDEADSGSELEMEDEEEEAMVEQEMVGLGQEIVGQEMVGQETEDQEMMEQELDIESMPFYYIDEEEVAVSPPYQHLQATAASPQRERSPTPPRNSLIRSSPDPRERSPLVHSPTPPPYSPLTSPEGSPTRAPPERTIAAFIEGQNGARGHSAGRASRGRGRGGRARGGRGRGGRNRGSSRRAASNAARGENVWRRGERIIEICLDDDDVPPSLREMVYEVENRRARSAQTTSRSRRNVRANDEVDENEDEFHDAESFMAHELFDGDRGAMEFQWSPMATFSGQGEEFQPEHPGPNVSASCAYEAFRHFWDDDIMEHIVRETNRYASELKSSSERFERDWYDTNVHEVFILFAFWMMLGVIRMPSITSCFSTSHLLKTSIFRSLMTEARYWLLNRALHFVDNSTRRPDSSKLFCLGPVANHLNNKFMEAYTPAQNISIDESLTLWKGNLSFRQYIKTKAARFGIKTFELCESATGYLWSFVIYTGKDGSTVTPARIAKSTEVVVNLMRPLLHKGYRLFMDNWFNSPLLARYLKRNATDCVGTLRRDRKNVPAIIQLATMPQGTCVARHSGDVVVMAYQDKKLVHTISTCHGTESVSFENRPGRPSHHKPAVIADYNKFMGGVDKKDQMLEPYLIERKKNRKWYKKLFKRLLNVSIFNSRILVHKSRDEEVKQQAFRLELVDSIMKAHLPHVPQARRSYNTVVSNRNATLSEVRFSNDHHFVARSNKELPQGAHPTSLGRTNCVWCSTREHRYRRTVYICEKCEVPLCIDGCFKKYHTVP